MPQHVLPENKGSMTRDSNGNLSPVEKVLCLQRVDVFKYATTEMLGYISSIADEVTLPQGSVIFAEQEMSDSMYIVVAGRVRLEKEGKEVVVVGSYQSVGTWALFDTAPRIMTATAIEDVVLLKISSEAFYEFLADHDEITPVIFKAIIERVKILSPDAV
jgi:CRP/FNR family transcriptional regulator, cyclic AMP receptor protein